MQNQPSQLCQAHPQEQTKAKGAKQASQGLAQLNSTYIQMADGGGGCLTTLRSIVFILNLFFWLAGLGILGLGLWLRFDGAVSELIALHGDTNNFYITCYLLIAAGALMTIIGFLGCCGAWRLNQSMLTLFECCGVKSYRDWLHSSWGHDVVGRTELGIGSSSIGKVPRSCCNEDGLRDYPTNCGVSFDKLELWTYEPFLHTKGCSDALYEAVYTNLDIAIAVCVIIGALQKPNC
ncbi:unnamed protein product [Anisakis simplex]|uniref:Tetraspanin n=1 Tax=Anisakis simplex TaxID=6269 RepID=A0A0M3JTR7_ANISI|nr:unnamed protein product [Anisakis simplex]